MGSMRNAVAPVLAFEMRRAWWLRVHEVLCRFSFLQDLKASEERSTSGLQDNAKAELALGTSRCPELTPTFTCCR